MKRLFRVDDKNRRTCVRKVVAIKNISVIISNKKYNKTNMKAKFSTNSQLILEAIKRPVYFVSALLMIFAGSSGVVSAVANGGQVQERSIKMSDSGPSGGTITTGVGSGTNVTYRVTFKSSTSYTAKGFVVDFCAGTGGTPFIGDATCAAPTDFTVGTTPTIDTATTGGVNGVGSGWTAASLNSGQTFYMSNSTGTALTAGTAYTFAIEGVTNTSDLGTFYARLITYDDDTAPASYTHSAPGTYQDYGGFALSTAEVIDVTAKVQETLTFCVSGPTIAPTGPTDCTDTTTPAIILGHGTNNTLDSSAVDTNDIWSYVSTNALHGVTIRMHNSNACGGLSTDGGTTCNIPALNSGAAAPSAFVANTAGFGMFCEDSIGGTGNSVDCDGAYRDGTHNTFPTDVWYGMDSTSSGENVTATYGDTVSAATAPTNGSKNKYIFAATASDTTPAGIYKASLAMIATGSF